MRRKIKKLFVLIISMLIFTTQINVTNSIKAAEDAKIILENNTSRERFHVGRMIGESVPIDIKATSKTISGLKFTSSNSTVASVNTINGERKLVFKSEGTSVITMNVTVGKTSVTKHLLASCLTKKNLLGKLRSGAIVYQGCSDKQGISSDVSEIKGTNEKERDVDIKGVCGEYYQIFTKDGKTWTDRKEDFGYVKKKDVKIPVTDYEIPLNKTIYEGKTDKINIITSPEESEVNYSQTKWLTSNKEAVSVDNKGNITGVSIGKATITLEYLGKTRKCEVEVKPYVEVKSIRIIQDKEVVEDGTLGKLSVEILPENASIKEVDWKVDKNSIVRIEPNGTYLSTNPGVATITAISKDNGLTDTCKLTVTKVELKGINTSKDEFLGVGEIKKIKWSTNPVNATNKKVIFKSSNQNVVSIDNKGVVVGKKKGTAIITIKSSEGYEAKCNYKVVDYVEDMEFDDAKKSIKLNTSLKLKINIYPSDAYRNIKWRVEDDSVVSVDKDGNIKAKKLGTTEVIAYDRIQGAYDICAIKVVKKLKTKTSTKKTKKKTNKKSKKKSKKTEKNKKSSKKKSKKKTSKKNNKKK